MDFVTIISLLLAGIACGIVNVIGGGGSLLALPVLLALGLPAGVANGTNRVAILLQDITAVSTFHKQKQLPLREGLLLSIPVIIGALLGAWLAAVYLTETIMNIVILLLTVLMIAALFFQPDKWTRTKNSITFHGLTTSNFILLLFIGFYGGFIQAGFTYLVLAVLVLRMGHNMVTGDALKLFLNLMIIPVALVIFIYHNQIEWSYGLVMGIGSAVGGYWGVRFVRSWSPKFIRSILLILLVLSALYVIFFRMV